MTDTAEGLGEAFDSLRAGRLLTILTGAGISAESGLPTFRGEDGLWEGHRAEELATPEAFARDPVKVWRFYEWRRGLVLAATPNAGHRAVARLQHALPRVTVVTQNVDGLHQEGGSTEVVELHGSIRRVRCTREGTVRPALGGAFVELPPRCPGCGAVLRPDVVWFGEPLPEAAWRRAVEAARQSALFLVVGTSALVTPAAGLVVIAARAGAFVVEVNPDETEATPLAHRVLRAPAAKVLPRIADLAERATA